MVADLRLVWRDFGLPQNVPCVPHSEPRWGPTNGEPRSPRSLAPYPDLPTVRTHCSSPKRAEQIPGCGRPWMPSLLQPPSFSMVSFWMDNLEATSTLDHPEPHSEPHPRSRPRVEDGVVVLSSPIFFLNFRFRKGPPPTSRLGINSGNLARPAPTARSSLSRSNLPDHACRQVRRRKNAS